MHTSWKVGIDGGASGDDKVGHQGWTDGNIGKRTNRSRSQRQRQGGGEGGRTLSINCGVWSQGQNVNNFSSKAFFVRAR